MRRLYNKVVSAAIKVCLDFQICTEWENNVKASFYTCAKRLEKMPQK